MKTTPEDAFQAHLEDRGRRAPAGVAALGLLASALEPASRAEPDPRFRRRLRSELVALASMTDEDVFAAAVDRELVGASAVTDRGIGSLVALASALEPVNATPVLPDARFRYGLRARLIDMATERPPLRARIAASVAERSTRMRRSLRVVTATGVAAMTLLVSGATMVAAQGALPGDMAYGAKLAQESISLWTVSGANEGLHKLNFGRRRLDEVRGLTERGVDRRDLYTDTLNRMDALTIDATELILADGAGARSAVRRLSNFAEVQASDLSALLERLPPAVRPAARDSLGVIESAGAKADAVLDGCQVCPVDAPTGSSDQTQTPTAGSAPEGSGCSLCGRGGETSDPEVTPGNDAGQGSGKDEGSQDETPPPPPPPVTDEDAVDLPPVDGTTTDETVEDTLDGLLDTLGVDPPAVATPTPTLPVAAPAL